MCDVNIPATIHRQKNAFCSAPNSHAREMCSLRMPCIINYKPQRERSVDQRNGGTTAAENPMPPQQEEGRTRLRANSFSVQPRRLEFATGLEMVRSGHHVELRSRSIRRLVTRLAEVGNSQQLVTARDDTLSSFTPFEVEPSSRCVLL